MADALLVHSKKEIAQTAPLPRPPASGRHLLPGLAPAPCRQSCAAAGSSATGSTADASPPDLSRRPAGRCGSALPAAAQKLRKQEPAHCTSIDTSSPAFLPVER